MSEHLHGKHPVFLYTFPHGNKRKVFGPYVTQDDAKEAFQRIYGYWPEDAVKVEDYLPIAVPDIPLIPEQVLYNVGTNEAGNAALLKDVNDANGS